MYLMYTVFACSSCAQLCSLSFWHLPLLSHVIKFKRWWHEPEPGQPVLCTPGHAGHGWHGAWEHCRGHWAPGQPWHWVWHWVSEHWARGQPGHWAWPWAWHCASGHWTGHWAPGQPSGHCAPRCKEETEVTCSKPTFSQLQGFPPNLFSMAWAAHPETSFR